MMVLALLTRKCPGPTPALTDPILLSREDEDEDDEDIAKAMVPDPNHSVSNNQYHPRAPIMLPSTPQTPPPVELPASADTNPGNPTTPLPRYNNNNWSRPFSWRRGVDYNYRPDKVGNMI